MIIYRRIFGNIDSQIKKEKLESIFNTKFEAGYFSKDIDENSVEYANLLPFLKSLNLDDGIIGTEFTKEEILNAEILHFTGGRTFSYPEPQEPVFLNNTYLDCCNTCGSHGIQKEDFVIKKDPKHNTISLGKLHWVFDELFIGTEISRNFFLKQLNLSERPVKISKKNKNADSVAQLEINEIDEELNMNGSVFTRCPACNISIYTPTTTGFFPSPKNKNFDIIKTREFFGSGHSARHRILVSNGVMQQMIRLKIAKQHQFVPCK